MGYLGATLTQVLTRAGGADVSVRDVTIAQMENGARECGWRHDFEKVSWVLFCLGKRRSTFGAHRDQTNLRATGAVRDVRGRWKSQNRKNVYLTPYVEEPLNSKVIKGFVLELRSRKCFSCFGIPMFYINICVINILCTFRIFGYLAMIHWSILRLRK